MSKYRIVSSVRVDSPDASRRMLRAGAVLRLQRARLFLQRSQSEQFGRRERLIVQLQRSSTIFILAPLDQHRGVFMLAVRKPSARADSRVHRDRRFVMPLRIVVSLHQRRQVAQITRGGPVTHLGPSNHRVPLGIRQHEFVDSRRALAVLDEHANSRQDRHRRQPIPVAAQRSEIFARKVLELNSGFRFASGLDMRQRQSGSRDVKHRILLDVRAQHRFELAHPPLLETNETHLRCVRQQRARLLAPLTDHHRVFRQPFALARVAAQQRSHRVRKLDHRAFAVQQRAHRVRRLDHRAAAAGFLGKFLVGLEIGLGFLHRARLEQIRQMHLEGSESPLWVLDAFRELHHLLRRLQPRIQVVRSPQRVMPHA